MNYLFLAFLVSFSLVAMEPAVIKMEGEEANEKTPLRPQKIVMVENDEKSAIYDGTRRFYDQKSYQRFRNQKLKECCVDNIWCCIGSQILGCIYGQTCGGCISICAGTKGMFLTNTSGGICLEFGAGGCATSAVFSSFPLGYYRFQQIKKIRQKNTSEHITMEQLEIPSQMLKATDAKKRIEFDKEYLEKHILKRAPKGDCMDRPTSFLCRYYPHSRTHQILKKRSQAKPLIPFLLANMFHKQHQFPKDLVKQIFSLINFSFANSYSHITEQELLYAIDLRRIEWNNDTKLMSYVTSAHLAQYGWIAFSRSEKYPIRCEKQYFNKDQISQASAHFYTTPSETKSMAIYLPYSLQLAQYYKFEEDPAYAIEYETPSNSKIKRLLEYRQEIISQRNGNAVQALIENNNNN